MSTGQFGDVCLGRPFRLISCHGWLFDPVSLICIHSHGGSIGDIFKQCTVRSTVLVFAASPLKMRGSALPPITSFLIYMEMRLRDVLLRQSRKPRAPFAL